MKCHSSKLSQWSECTVDIPYRLECHAVSSSVDETSRHWHLGRISPLPASIAMQPQTARSAQKLLPCTDTVDVDLQRFNDTPHGMHSHVYPSPSPLWCPVHFAAVILIFFLVTFLGVICPSLPSIGKKTCHDV
jgi:hypothetical protein